MLQNAVLTARRCFPLNTTGSLHDGILIRVTCLPQFHRPLCLRPIHRCFTLSARSVYSNSSIPKKGSRNLDNVNGDFDSAKKAWPGGGDGDGKGDSSGLRHESSTSWRMELDMVEDMIYALSTAEGRAGIAVVRVSGLGCLDVSFGVLLLGFLFWGSGLISGLVRLGRSWESEALLHGGPTALAQKFGVHSSLVRISGFH